MKVALSALASVATAVDLDVMATTQSFSYLKEQPTTLLLQNGYCNTNGGAVSSASVWRLSTTPG